MPLITVRAPVRATEDPEKVRQAILNLFPGSEVSLAGDTLVARTASLERFMTMIRNQRILDSARQLMREGVRGNCTVFLLNKQAAFVNRISAAEGRHALGHIEVTVEAGDIEGLIDEVAPRTVNGEEVR